MNTNPPVLYQENKRLPSVYFIIIFLLSVVFVFQIDVVVGVYYLFLYMVIFLLLYITLGRYTLLLYTDKVVVRWSFIRKSIPFSQIKDISRFDTTDFNSTNISHHDLIPTWNPIFHSSYLTLTLTDDKVIRIGTTDIIESFNAFSEAINNYRNPYGLQQIK